MVVIYGQSKLVQELARPGILPFSAALASNKPFKTPLFALFDYWAVSIAILFRPPPGDAYNSISSLIVYLYSIDNAFIALALLFLSFCASVGWHLHWISISTLFFLLSQIYSAVALSVPPSKGQVEVYVNLPYYIHAVIGLRLFGLGLLNWVLRFFAWPYLRSYRLDYVVVSDEYDDRKERLVNISLKKNDPYEFFYSA